jgi:hypothetical protein
MNPIRVRTGFQFRFKVEETDIENEGRFEIQTVPPVTLLSMDPFLRGQCLHLLSKTKYFMDSGITRLLYQAEDVLFNLWRIRKYFGT